MHRAAILLTVVIAVLGAGEAAPYQPPKEVPISGIGVRWDGKAVYPASHKPPAKLGSDLNQHIAWKARLENFAYGAPVEIGNRVVILCDADARYVFPVLYCYDAKNGALAWSAEVNPFDAFPQVGSAERKRLTDRIQSLWDDQVALFRAIAPVAAAKGEAGPDDPLLEKANAQLAERGMQIEKYKRSYGKLRYINYPEGYPEPKGKPDPELFGTYNIQPERSDQGAGRTGDAFGTPVSDGEKVYVITIHGTTAAFDLATGKRAWSATIGGGQYKQANHFMTSPRLYRDLVLSYFGDTNANAPDVIQALDRKTGKELWRHRLQGCGMPKPPEGPGGSRPGSSPLVMSVGDTDVCITGTGHVIRLPDGKVYEARLNNTLVPFAIDDEHDALFAGTSTDRGSYRYRLDLAIEQDDLKVTTGWVVGKSNRSYNVTFHQGCLYWEGYRIDPATGWPFGTKPAEGGDPRKGYPGVDKNAPDTRQFMLIANGHVYGLHEVGKSKRGPSHPQGCLEVYTLDGKQVSEARLTPPSEVPGYLVDQGFGANFSYSCPMSLGMEAIYLCDNQFLYCIR